MRLPSEKEVASLTTRNLRAWDLREFFSSDEKDFWVIHYRTRLKAILDAITTHVPLGGTVLDIGCSQATASILLAEKGFRMTAVDADRECLDYAELKHESGQIEFVCMDATQNLPEGLYDAVLLGEVIEHVPQPGKMLARCRERLKPGGALVMTTPNGLSPHNWLIKSYDPSRMESQRWEHVASGHGGRETHLFCFRPGQLRTLVRSSGYEIERHQLLNSYVINPIGLHKLVLPVKTAYKVNRAFSRIPLLSVVSTMTQMIIAKNGQHE